MYREHRNGYKAVSLWPCKQKSRFRLGQRYNVQLSLFLGRGGVEKGLPHLKGVNSKIDISSKLSAFIHAAKLSIQGSRKW
jgi:hypothetical protein